MNIIIEKLTKDSGEITPIYFDDVASEEQAAFILTAPDVMEESLAIRGDILHINNTKFLIEKDLTISEIKNDEYNFYKNMNVKDRILQWFESN